MVDGREIGKRKKMKLFRGLTRGICRVSEQIL